MNYINNTLCLVFAGGKSVRMCSNGRANKALLPVLPYKPTKMIDVIIDNCPSDTIMLMLKYKSQDFHLHFSHKFPVYVNTIYNGIAGALLEFKEIIRESSFDYVLIILGDTPLIQKITYTKMIEKAMEGFDIVLLCHKFLEKNHSCGYIDNIRSINRIIDYSEWKDYENFEKKKLEYCNSGPMVIRKECLCEYIQFLKPHNIKRVVNGETIVIQEYLYTDLVELFAKDNHKISYLEIQESEALGVNTPEDLKRIQEIFKKRLASTRKQKSFL